MVAIATVVKVTKVWLFFSPFGPKAHLQSHEDPTVNTRENMRPSFALYIYDVSGFPHFTYNPPPPPPPSGIRLGVTNTGPWGRGRGFAKLIFGPPCIALGAFLTIF